MGAEVYIVIEMQISKEGAVGNIVTVYNDMNEADSKYHQILAAAAVSNVYRHTATMLNERGDTIKCESYKHVTATESEA